jgi:hypothetical protein
MLRALPLLALCACATAKVVGPPVVQSLDDQIERTVVIEPFFEMADWQTTTKTEYATLYGGRAGTQTVTVQREVQEKPFFATVPALATEHRAVLAAVKALRPAWKVGSTSSVASIDGPLSLVRVIVQGGEIVGTNRALKNLCFGFGFVILPLQIYNFWPVTETQRIYGAVERYLTDGPSAKARLVRYPTQPDFAFNASGLKALGHPFGLDVTYEEGLLASDAPRKEVVITAFAERLAAAIVALVEEP